MAGLNEALLGQGGRAETAAHGAGAGRYHGDRRERGLPDRCGAAGQGGGQAGAGGAAGAGGGRGHRDGDDRPAAGCWPAGAGDGRHDARPGPAGPGREPAGRSGRVTGDLADLAEAAAAQAAAVLRNGRRAIPKALSGRMRGRLRRALGELAVTIERTATVAAQARFRLAGRCPTARPGWSACMTPTPGRSARAASTSRWSSGTRPRSSTTTTASSWTMAWRPVTLRTPPARAGDQPDRAAGRPHAPSVTADRRYGEPATERDLRALGVDTVAISRRARPSAARRAVTCPRLPHPRQVADRLRGPDQLPQAQIRLGPHPAGRPPRSFHLVRARGIHPQPGQDQRRLPADPIWAAHLRIPPRSFRPNSALRLFQVEVIEQALVFGAKSTPADRPLR